MEAIRGLIQNLVFLIVLVIFLEMFLPAGEMKRYTKMIMGLLIVLAVLQTVSSLTRKGLEINLPELTSKASPSDLTGILENGKKLSDYNQQQALKEYQQGLSRQVIALAKNKEINVLKAEVQIKSEPEQAGYGQLEEIKLVLPEESGEKSGEETKISPVMVGKREIPKSKFLDEKIESLKKTLAGFYNISPEQIKISSGVGE